MILRMVVAFPVPERSEERKTSAIEANRREMVTTNWRKMRKQG